MRNKSALVGLVTLIGLMVLSIIVPYLSSHTYYKTNLILKSTPPCKQFWFGSDTLGRDIFVRIWFGIRISFFVGISAAVMDLIIGVIYGFISGITGGKTDEIMMRVIDIFSSIPNVLIVILITFIMRASITSVIFAIGITGWLGMARMMRGQVLQIKQLDYTLSAYMIGASRYRRLIKYFIPNCIGLIIGKTTLSVSFAVFYESFLSFLGLGIQVPMSSLGTMASDGISYLRDYPWMIFFPACFIFVILFSLQVLGDAARDAFDPRLRK